MITIDQKELPLVSVVLLTYNSANFVLDALESVYRQTYGGPIELIISDDSSSDNTVRICREWLKKKSDRFFKSDIICVSENTGTSENCNRACKKSSGKWIKLLAGDDILTDEAIGKLIDYTLTHRDVYFVTGALQKISSSGFNEVLYPIKSTVDLSYIIKNPLTTCMGAAFFIASDMLKYVKYFDVVYRNIEDLPFLYKCVGLGFALHSTSEIILNYRQPIGSTSDREINGNKTIVEQMCVECFDRYISEHCNIIQRWWCFWYLLPIRFRIKGAPRFLVSFLCFIRMFMARKIDK